MCQQCGTHAPITTPSKCDLASMRNFVQEVLYSTSWTASVVLRCPPPGPEQPHSFWFSCEPFKMNGTCTSLDPFASLASAPAALSILVLLQTLQMDRARGHLLSNNNTTDLVTPTLRARHSETFRRTSGTACYTHQYSPGWRTGAQGPPALAYTFGANGVADVEMAPPPSVRLV